MLLRFVRTYRKIFIFLLKPTLFVVLNSVTRIWTSKLTQKRFTISMLTFQILRFRRLPLVHLVFVLLPVISFWIISYVPLKFLEIYFRPLNSPRIILNFLSMTPILSCEGSTCPWRVLPWGNTRRWALLLEVRHKAFWSTSCFRRHSIIHHSIASMSKSTAILYCQKGPVLIFFYHEWIISISLNLCASCRLVRFSGFHFHLRWIKVHLRLT